MYIGREINQEVAINGMEEEGTTETSRTSTMKDNQIGVPRTIEITTGVGVVTLPLGIPYNTPHSALASHPWHRYCEPETTRMVMFLLDIQWDNRVERWNKQSRQRLRETRGQYNKHDWTCNISNS